MAVHSARNVESGLQPRFLASIVMNDQQNVLHANLRSPHRAAWSLDVKTAPRLSN
jgi:hypothetical protein